MTTERSRRRAIDLFRGAVRDLAVEYASGHVSWRGAGLHGDIEVCRATLALEIGDTAADEESKEASYEAAMTLADASERLRRR